MKILEIPGEVFKKNLRKMFQSNFLAVPKIFGGNLQEQMVVMFKKNSEKF